MLLKFYNRDIIITKTVLNEIQLSIELLFFKNLIILRYFTHHLQFYMIVDTVGIISTVLYMTLYLYLYL